jgi:uncharacterized delta-60 repeat protein
MARRAVLKLETLNERIAPAAGGLDPTFGTGGTVATPIGPGDDTGFSVAIDSIGRIVVAGRTFNGSDSDFAVARYTIDGTLDTSFDGDGVATTPIGAAGDFGQCVVIDALDRIILVGQSDSGTDLDFAIVRYNTDGSLDTSFDDDGKATIAFGPGNDYGTCVTVDPDGRIVVAGYISNGSNFDVGIARLNGDGTLDTTFSGDGQATRDIVGTDDFVASVITDDLRRVIVTGSAFNGSNHDELVARFNSDGTPDNTFGSSGWISTIIGPSDEGGTTVAIDASGRIVVGGRTFNGGNFDLFLIRHNSDGTRDSTFGGNGIVVTAIGTGQDYGERVLIDGVGRVLLAGTSSNGSNLDLALVRYNPNGSLDTSFDVDGKVTTPIGSGDDFGQGMAIDNHGRIVVGGVASDGGNWDFGVARYFSDSFGLVSSGLSHTFVEDSPPLTIDNGLSFINAPNANLAGATVQIDNYISAEDVLAYTLQGGITSNFDSVSGLLTLGGSASIADYQAVLRSLTYTNISDAPTTLDRTITITVDDGEPTQNLASATYTIHVVALNDSPGFTSDGVLFAILQGNAASVGQKVAGLFAGRFADPDTGSSLRGIAVVGNSANASTEGAWQYSTDNGVTWADIGVVSDDAMALALNAFARIRFVPVISFTGQPTPLSVRAIDNSFGGFFSSDLFRVTVDARANGGTNAIGATVTPIRTTVFPAGTGGNNAPNLFGVPVSRTIDELTELTFTATANDPDLDPVLTFTLDSAPDTASIDPDSGVFTWTTTETDGPDTYIFNVQVSDGLATTVRTITVMVREANTSPMIADVPPTANLVRGDTLTFDAGATDADLLNGSGNTLTFSLVGAPPGAFIDPDTGVFTWTPTDAVALGDYTFNVRVADDGVPATKSDTAEITVTLSNGLLDGGDLLIGGTAGNDTITVNLARDPSKVAVVLNRVKLGEFDLAAITGSIIARTGIGADRVTISTKIFKPAILDGGPGIDILTGGGGDDLILGGDGNDVLNGGANDDTVLGGAGNDRVTGGAGNNVLVGNAGNDILTGGSARDILIGGAGLDKLNGGAGEDLLIGGKTDFDTDLTGLTNILAEWTSPFTPDYAIRIQHLTGTPGGENAGTFLSSSTVDADIEKDTLTGATGKDWFVTSVPDILDVKAAEQKLLIV